MLELEQNYSLGDQKMLKMTLTLNRRFAPMLETKAFSRIFDIIIFLNPVAFVPQVWTALTVQSTEAVSIGMLAIFTAIQTVMALQGIRIKSPSLFFSMAIGTLESTAIIIIVLVRG